MLSLPSRYKALASILDSKGPPSPTGWLGDAGFRLLPGDLSDGDWIQRLSEERWRGMHPDLIPFAQDGYGNRFCFVHSERRLMHSNESIVYWMYETYQAVPITSSFDSFLHWLALTAYISEQRGSPTIPDGHLSNELLPILREAGLDLSPETLLAARDSDTPGLHRALLQIDPEAAGSRLAVAERYREQGRVLDALTQSEEARRAFPEFFAAWGLEARLLAGEGDATRQRVAQIQALRSPLVYAGDETMPFLRNLTATSVDDLVSTLAWEMDSPELLVDQPLSSFIEQEDPTVPESWLSLAYEYAKEDDLESAAMAASNALFLGFSSENGTEIHGLLADIYGELGWSWHARMMHRWGAEP